MSFVSNINLNAQVTNDNTLKSLSLSHSHSLTLSLFQLTLNIESWGHRRNYWTRKALYHVQTSWQSQSQLLQRLARKRKSRACSLYNQPGRRVNGYPKQLPPLQIELNLGQLSVRLSASLIAKWCSSASWWTRERRWGARNQWLGCVLAAEAAPEWPRCRRPHASAPCRCTVSLGALSSAPSAAPRSSPIHAWTSDGQDEACWFDRRWLRKINDEQSDGRNAFRNSFHVFSATPICGNFSSL